MAMQFNWNATLAAGSVPHVDDDSMKTITLPVLYAEPERRYLYDLETFWGGTTRQDPGFRWIVPIRADYMTVYESGNTLAMRAALYWYFSQKYRYLVDVNFDHFQKFFVDLTGYPSGYVSDYGVTQFCGPDKYIEVVPDLKSLKNEVQPETATQALTFDLVLVGKGNP